MCAICTVVTVKDFSSLIVCSIVYILSAAFSPVFGFFIDKLGKNVFWGDLTVSVITSASFLNMFSVAVIAAVVVTIGAHALLAFTFLNPWIAMVSQ